MPTRPKLTPAAREKFLGALMGGADLEMASRVVGITRKNAFLTAERDPAFKEAIADAKAYADDQVVKRLFDRAMEGDTTAMIFWLKNRRADEWRDRHDLSATLGFPEGPLTIVLSEAPSVSLETRHAANQNRA